MNRIIYYLFFFTTLSYAQTTSNNKTLDQILEDFFQNTCENDFAVQGNYYSYEIKLVKEKEKFFIQQNESNKPLLEIICNGEIMWSIDYNYEEISIYSLTDKEKEYCFFVEKFLSAIEDWNIENCISFIKFSLNIFNMLVFFF